MTNTNILLAGTLALVLIAGLGTPAFASNPAAVDNLPSAVVTAETPLEPAFTSGSIWGIEPTFGIATIFEYDPITKTLVTSFPTNCSPPICNGRGLAHDGTNLRYTVVGGGFAGEGIIRTIATTGGPDITSIPDPYGPGGRGVGALDWDPVNNSLWGISYLPIGGFEEVTEINPITGAVLARCNVPFGGGGAGTETLVIDPKARTLLTNAGEPLPFIDEYKLPVTNTPGTPCTLVSSFTPTPISIGGVDFDNAGNLLAHDVSGTQYDLGTRPFSVIQDFFASAFIEDITTTPQKIMVGGELLPIDTTALLLAGAQTNAVWIISALAVIGSVAFGALYITTKRN